MPENKSSESYSLGVSAPWAAPARPLWARGLGLTPAPRPTQGLRRVGAAREKPMDPARGPSVPRCPTVCLRACQVWSSPCDSGSEEAACRDCRQLWPCLLPCAHPWPSKGDANGWMSFIVSGQSLNGPTSRGGRHMGGGGDGGMWGGDTGDERGGGGSAMAREGALL